MSELLYVTKALSSGYKHPSGSEVSILVESTKDRGEAPHLGTRISPGSEASYPGHRLPNISWTSHYGSQNPEYPRDTLREASHIDSMA